MIDEEIRELIVHTVRETVQAVMQQNDSVHLQTMLDEMRDEVEASAGAEHPYGADSAAPPGNFEPEFENGRLARVGLGFYPFGRLFYCDVTVDGSAKIASGLIYLEVTYPSPSETSGGQTSSSSSSSPTAIIKGYAYEGDGEGAVAPYFRDRDEKTKSRIPLYEIKDGQISIDHRSAMSLTVREL